MTLLPEILLSGEDIYSELPISERLLYSLLKDLIPLLVEKSKNRFHMPVFHCPITKKIYDEEEKIAGTGMSFGVDSLYSYYSHYNFDEILSDYNVKAITYFNHGSLNGEYKNSSSQIRENFYRISEKVASFAKEQRVQYLSIDCNIDEFLIDPFEDSAHYDIFTLPRLGTENTEVYSDGMSKTRFQKIEAISKIPETKNYLFVCWRELYNCSGGPKYIRTMAALDILGKLKNYESVFDLNKYYEDYVWNWAKILSLKNSDYFYAEIINEAQKHKFEIRWESKILACVFYLSRRFVPTVLLHKIQEKIRR